MQEGLPMSDRYKFWRECLAAKDARHPLPTATVDDPQLGFWRMRRGTGKIPVAVFLLDGVLSFKIGREVVGANMGTELWSHYCAHPISEAEYRKVAEQGGDWSDSDPTVALMTNGKSSTKSTQNIPENIPAGAISEFRQQIATAAAGLDAYEKIESDESAARAAGLRNLLLKLKKDADDQRAALKAPHLKAGQEIDATWNPLVKEAGAAADKIRNAISAWETLKRQAAAEAARRDAERAREAEQAGRPAPAPVAPNAPAPSQQVRPTFGKASSVSTYQHVLKIDPDKVLAALRERPEWYGVLQYLEETCQRLARNGIILDGVLTEERARVK
jgi:hypothetical protein